MFFLNEMERKKFKIPRMLVQEIFRQKYAIEIFRNLLISDNK